MASNSTPELPQPHLMQVRRHLCPLSSGWTAALGADQLPDGALLSGAALSMGVGAAMGL